MSDDFWGENARWEICMGRKATDVDGGPYLSGKVLVNGMEIPASAVEIAAVAGGLTSVTLTFFPRNLVLYTGEKPDGV